MVRFTYPTKRGSELTLGLGKEVTTPGKDDFEYYVSRSLIGTHRLP